MTPARPPANAVEEANPILAGPLGRIVQLTEGRTEADPVATTLDLAALVATSLGMGPRIRIGSTSHPIRLYVLVVGKSATARKGTAWGVAQRIAVMADPSLLPRIQDGFGSGEIICDAFAPDKDGQVDTRLCYRSDEFGRVLSVAGRVGDSTTAVLRTAWAEDRFQARARQAKAKGSTQSAEGHLCVVGDVTPSDLGKEMDPVSLTNGYIGRFLFVRSEGGPRIAPGGPDWWTPELEAAAKDLGERIKRARRAQVSADPAAARWWESDVYPSMRAQLESVPYPIDDCAGRWEAYCWRLAGLVALLDGTDIMRHHLEWALAVWNHSWSVVESLWGPGGSAEPDFESPIMRDRARLRPQVLRLLPAVEAAGVTGLTGRQCHAALSNNVTAIRMAEIRKEGTALGLWHEVERWPNPTRQVGRPQVFLVARAVDLPNDEAPPSEGASSNGHVRPSALLVPTEAYHP